MSFEHKIRRLCLNKPNNSRRETSQRKGGAFPMKEPIPEHIDRYEILKLVGTGGMGLVYKASDSKLNRVVALKVPRSDRVDRDPHWKRRFLREARSAAGIHHPNVCAIYDVGEADGVPFVVMSFVEGLSLAEWLEQEHPYRDPVHAARLVSQVAHGLKAVHDHGLVHRDLKPGNILIEEDGRAILTDFGLTRPNVDCERLTGEGYLLGTPMFMAPEQVAGQSDRIGPWTDLYSLGVIFYRLLTGRLPFQGDAVSVLWKIGN